jgi:hypothetical protein
VHSLESYSGFTPGPFHPQPTPLILTVLLLDALLPIYLSSFLSSLLTIRPITHYAYHHVPSPELIVGRRESGIHNMLDEHPLPILEPYNSGPQNYRSMSIHENEQRDAFWKSSNNSRSAAQARYEPETITPSFHIRRGRKRRVYALRR